MPIGLLPKERSRNADTNLIFEIYVKFDLAWSMMRGKRLSMISMHLSIIWSVLTLYTGEHLNSRHIPNFEYGHSQLGRI
jgi:hypothetical protein